MYLYFVFIFVFVFVFMDARLAKHKPPRPSETDCLLDSFLNLCSVQCVSSTTFHFTAVTNRCVTCICICGCVSFCSVNVFSPVFSVFVFPYVCRTKCYLRITRGWMELVSIYSLVSASGSISQHWQARAEFLRAKRRPRGNPSYLSGHLSDRCQHRKQ